MINFRLPYEPLSDELLEVVHFRFELALSEELGILLLILGQDKKTPIALKVGGGKPIGMGTMTAVVTAITQTLDIRDRYRSYTVDNSQLTGTALQTFIQTQITTAKNSHLLEKAQWQQLAAILKYPGEQEPPEGMY